MYSSDEYKAKLKAVNSKKPFRLDGYVNLLNKYGMQRDNSEAYAYERENLTPETVLTSNYETNGLFAKIIDIPAQEAVKKGFNLHIADEKVEEYVQKRFRKIRSFEIAEESLKWSRLYGGALAVMLIDDGATSLEQPVNWKRAKKIEEIVTYERVLVTPDYASLYSNYGFEGISVGSVSKFRMPQYYNVFSIYGSFRVHESRCLVFRNGTMPENASTNDYRFWGIPEYNRIKRALRETVTSHSDAVKLLERSVQAVYKMKNLSQLLSTDEGEDQALRRLEIIDTARGFLNSIAIDSEGEDYDFKTTTLTGVKEVIDSACNMLSALTEIPQTKLFGRSPAGMNATGESDLENYYNFIGKIQQSQLRDNFCTLVDAIIQIGINTGELSEKPEYELEFEPLWNEKESDRAAIEQTNAQTDMIKAQTAQMYIEMGVLDPAEERARLCKEGKFGITDAELPQQEDDVFNDILQKMQDGEHPKNPFSTDSADDDVQWITTKNGAHIPLKDGEAVGGPLKGESFSNAQSRQASERSNIFADTESMNSAQKVAHVKKTLDSLAVGDKLVLSLKDSPDVGSDTITKTGENSYSFEGLIDQDGDSFVDDATVDEIAERVESDYDFSDFKAEVTSEKPAAKTNYPNLQKSEDGSVKGKVIDVDNAQYQALKQELQQNTKGTVSDEDIDGYLDAIDEYRSGDYIPVIAASADFGGEYADYSNALLGQGKEKEREEATARAERLEHFIQSADKYEGSVSRVMGFEVGGELDDGSFDRFIQGCKVGKEIDMGHLSSWTTSGSTADDVLYHRTSNDETAEKKIGVVLNCANSSSGVDIGRFSKANSQGEVIFSKNQKFIVKSVTKTALDDEHEQYDIEVEEAPSKGSRKTDSAEDLYGAADSVGVVVVQDGKVLVGNRDDNNQICGPGGHIESWEDAERAAVRETEEEFGITPERLIPLGLISDMKPEYNKPFIFAVTEFKGSPLTNTQEMRNNRFSRLSALKNEVLFEPFKRGVDLMIENANKIPELAEFLSENHLTTGSKLGRMKLENTTNTDDGKEFNEAETVRDKRGRFAENPESSSSSESSNSKGESEKKSEESNSTSSGSSASNGNTVPAGYVPTTPKQFKQALLTAKQTIPENGRWRVADDHTEEDYANDKLLQTKGGSTVAVTSDGDIVSVCVNKNGSDRGRDLLKTAIENGGDRLDAFGEGLYQFYTKNGFEPVSWTHFDRDYAPHDWKPEYGEEPVIFYKHTGKKTEESYSDFISRVKAHDSYAEAQDYRDKEIDK